MHIQPFNMWITISFLAVVVVFCQLSHYTIIHVSAFQCFLGVATRNKRFQQQQKQPFFTRGTCCYSSTSPKQQQQQQSEASFTNNKNNSNAFSSSSSSNFWIAKPQKYIPNESEIIPSDYNLDTIGPLPFGAYRTYTNNGPRNEQSSSFEINYEPKRNCLLTVSVDAMHLFQTRDDKKRQPQQGTTTGFVEKRDVVQTMQSFIDAGLTSFQITPFVDPTQQQQQQRRFLPSSKSYQDYRAWSEKVLYRNVRKETPASVLNTCRFSVQLNPIPSSFYMDDEKDRYNSQSFGNGWIVREAVCDSLLRIGGDALDCVQVPYQEDSPYHLDVLNVLFDMQREGLIRSIEGLNMPTDLLSSAESCGFHLDNNQIQCNILDPTSYQGDMERFCNSIEGRMKLLTSSPLAGGLLTDRFINTRLTADGKPPPGLTPSQHRHFKTTLNSWAECHEGGGSTPWTKFHNLVLGTLGNISFKHRTSAAAVALRWNMQMNKHLGSVIVRSSLGLGKDGVGEDGRPYERPQDLRKAFMFELDEEDMERLWNVAGKKDLPVDGIDDFLNGEGGGFSLPDLSNTKLWL